MPTPSERQEALGFLMRHLKSELASDRPHIARVSIALGLLEIPLTSKREDERIWPENLEAEVEKHYKAFREFVKGVHQECEKKNIETAREKIKLLANSVWAKLTGVFSKDVLHAQHLGCFTPFLLMDKLRGRRQLDCAGVVTTVFAASKILESDFDHADLNQLCMQVSEDHCWLTLDRSGGRLGSIEITTDRAEKRGLVVDESAWKGWLYCAGHGTVMDAKKALAAIVTSINPSIVDRPVNGIDSEDMQFLQCKILGWMDEHRQDLTYPNSVCTLADLYEVAWQDSVDKAILTPNGKDLKVFLREGRETIEALFQRAMGNGKQAFWYPFSYHAGSAVRFSKFLVEKCPVDILGKEYLVEIALSALDVGWTALGGGRGGGVLKTYRFASGDEQLYKDIEGLLEECVKAFEALQKFGGFDGGSHWMKTMLEFLDAWCHLFDGGSVPSKWITMIIKIAKLIPQEHREKGARQAQVASPALQKSLTLWGSLRPSTIHQAFEVLQLDDQGEGRRKRRRQR
ncbi:hypothetical protein BSKO_08390 [Bryopsis sp. KO-2023]|nr:hypothetical protein BSKO_08390 [Bryopsis sp. KO-2023]